MITLQAYLSERVTELRHLLARHSTRSVAGWCFGPIITAQQEHPNKRLSSPNRQIAFLLALLLSTPEPEAPTDLNETDWGRARTLLNELFSAYAELYSPTADERSKVNAEWMRVREVSMAAFFHYFNSGLIASVEQVVHRIATYVVPFDDELKCRMGITASAASDICDYISKTLQGDLHSMQLALSKENYTCQSMIDRAASENLSLDDLKRAESKPKFHDPGTASC